MTADSLSQDPERRLFQEALDQPAGPQRSAWLKQACGGDEALERRIQSLLRVQEEETQFLPNDMPAIETAPAEQPGERIGRYKLLQQIGEGGFGTVWMAEQIEPVSRRVALKIIKLGMDTQEVIARFEAERQALAMMDHPNIARVLDAGATDKGRPFFVMELVKGIPITQFCDERQLGTRERLLLFGDVCSAINHAHQKGVIHRDIKPSNVMVTLHGDKAVAKVIDFGIAKATLGKLTEKTLFTRFEQFIGTPVYMSPEQAALSGLDIDTRSDIYALGILLYELLTGKPPFDAKSLASAGYDEMRRIIREVEPPKPSTRLNTIVGDERTTLAKARHIEPEKLSRMVEPDLDWIVMKAIEKDRSRRYETANALALDIQHFLSDEPVSATPPSAGYRFRKFARRNKTALRVAAGIATMLVAATGISTWQAVRATKAQELAAKAEKLARDRLGEVAAERDQKDQARKDAEAIATFLGGAFQSPDPARNGRMITVAETLDTAVKNLDLDLAAQPARRAQLQATLGTTYYSLGLYREAILLLEKVMDYHRAASDKEHPDTLDAMHNLAVSYAGAGRRNEALKMFEELLPLRRKVLGPEHPDTLGAMHSLAISLADAGRENEALRMLEELLTLRRKLNGPEHPDTLLAMNSLAASFYAAGRLDEALKLQQEVLTLRRKVLGPEHPNTLKAMHNLAVSWDAAGRRAEALKLEEEVLRLSRKVLGPEHPDTLSAMSNLAASSAVAGRGDEALKLLEEVLTLMRRVNGPEHPDTLKAMNNLAAFYFDAGRRDEALKLLEDVLTLRRKVLGLEHPDTLKSMQKLARSYADAGRRDETLKLKAEIEALRRAAFPAIRATIVAPDSEWKWLHPTDGKDPAEKVPDFHNSFFLPNFDVSAWKSGRDSSDPAGGFGYGPGFTSVDIGKPENEAHRHTSYFRHTFTTDKEHTNLELRCQRDDGLIVYLDGKEVLRDNMPPGADAYLLHAAEPEGPENDGVVHRFPIPGTLAAGPHTLAISVHNTAKPSSDLRLGGIALVEINLRRTRNESSVRVGENELPPTIRERKQE